MKVLVIIVTYNAMRWIDRCLGSLRTSTCVPDVFVVDNGSTDGTQSYIRDNYSEVIFIQSNENIGFGKANNLGLQYAKDNNYDYVYLLNQDAWIFPDTLGTLIEISKRNPEYGILSPFQMEANLEHIDKVFKRIVCSWQSSPYLLDELYLKKGNEIISVEFIMAAHWFITRQCFLKVGGFSPTFPHYGEDYNYIHRAHFWGFRIGLTPALQVVHDREDRPVPQKKQIYLKYIFGLVKLSNPSINVAYAFSQIIYISLRSLFTFKSLIPIWNLVKICLGSLKILSNRKISIRHECAFLS